MSASSPSRRIDTLDSLRGVALFGILAVNLPYFSLSIYAEPVVAGSGDAVALWLMAFFGQVKAFSLFSFLFGYGLAIQLARAAAGGDALGPRYARRLVGIFAFGVVHAVFLFTGDVLAIYAALGAVLWLTRRWSPRQLVGLTVASTVVAAFAYALIAWPIAADPALAAAKAELAIGADRAFSGSFLEAAGQRLRDLPSVFPFLVLYNGPLALAMFALGLAAGKVELFSDLDRWWPRMRRALPWALGVGGVGNLAYAMTSAAPGVVESLWGGPVPPWVSAVSMASVAVAGPALMVAGVVGIVAAERAGRLEWMLRPLRAAGRLSLTNYLGESLLAGAVFGGWGLGLYGEVGLAECLLLTPVLFGILVVFSSLWLRVFRNGPAEWVLRSWTYFDAQPILKSPRTASAPSPSTP